MSHPLAVELNDLIRREAPEIFSMLSGLGREFYFPKGILTQTGEARQKAKRFNATIGIAKEKGEPMFLPAVTPARSPWSAFPASICFCRAFSRFPQNAMVASRALAS